jgi:hypothetical protein
MLVKRSLSGKCSRNKASQYAKARKALNKSRLGDAVENGVLVDTSATLNGGDDSGKTADFRGVGVAEQGEDDAS